MADMVSCARTVAGQRQPSRTEDEEDKERPGEMDGRKGSACMHSRKAGGEFDKREEVQNTRLGCSVSLPLVSLSEGGHGTMDNWEISKI